MVETRCKSKNMHLHHVSSFSYPFRLLFIIITKIKNSQFTPIVLRCLNLFIPYFKNLST